MIPVRLLAVALLAFAAGCVTPWTVDRFEAPEADVAGRGSFAWKAGEVATPLTQDPGMLAALESRVRAAVTGELVRRGYTETADPARADMLVSFQVAGTQRVEFPDVRRVGAPSPNQVLTPGNLPPPPASELPRMQTIREGTVVVFAEEPASGRVVWRGSVSAERRVSNDEAALRQVVEIAHQIAREFPERRTGP